jgi:hypothetical protein
MALSILDTETQVIPSGRSNLKKIDKAIQAKTFNQELGVFALI